MSETMRAAMFDRYGAPGELYVGTRAGPVPGPTDVLVRVAASSVSGGEVIARQGRLRLLTGRKFPQQVGIDLVGEAVAVGVEVTDVAIGDRIWGAVDERGPRGAAAGVQIGAMLGAHVTALANPSMRDFLHGLGADEVIDYRTPARDLGRYDVIFDTRGTDLRAFRRQLTTTGRMVTIAFDIDHPARSLGYIAASRLHGSRRVRLFLGHPRRELFSELARMVDRGDLRPILDEVYPLDRIDEAHARLEQGGVRGTIVVRVSADDGDDT